MESALQNQCGTNHGRVFLLRNAARDDPLWPNELRKRRQGFAVSGAGTSSRS